MPEGLDIIDLCVSIPEAPGILHINPGMAGLLRDPESRAAAEHPTGHLFKGTLPEALYAEDPVPVILEEMDRNGIARAMVDVNERNLHAQRALEEHPDRFVGSWDVDPNGGMEAVRALRVAVERWGVKAATSMPASCNPPAPINDKRWYPVYAACIDLDIPICLCTGVPGPRVPMEPQYVGHLDEVCWFFPELKVVMRHGGEPWTELAVQLLLKWPNLYYSTSAFAPKHYPKAIIDFANKRGRDKVMYAGYYPSALSLDRIVSELRELPLRDEVWEPFLVGNAQRVFGL